VRLALDILISAVFAVFAAGAGLVLGLVWSLVVIPVFFPRPVDDAVAFTYAVYAILLPALCSVIGGIWGFPLCGIWLNQRRQQRKLQRSALRSI